MLTPPASPENKKLIEHKQRLQEIVGGSIFTPEQLGQALKIAPDQIRTAIEQAMNRAMQSLRLNPIPESHQDYEKKARQITILEDTLREEDQIRVLAELLVQELAFLEI